MAKKKAKKTKANQKAKKRTAEPRRTEACGRTRDECAQRYGVSTRTVAAWLKDPTFPGQSATPGQQDGWFPYDRIDVWLRTRPDKAGSPDQSARSVASAELIAVRAKREALRLERESGQVLDADSARKTIERQIAIAKTILDPLPDRFAALIPAKAGERVKAKVTILATTVLNEAYAAIAESLFGDVDAPSDA